MLSMIEADARQLLPHLKRDLSGCPEPRYPSALAPPAVRVIDCVLSLRKSYESVVLPRVTQFRAQHADVRNCADLVQFIRGFASPHAFAKSALRMDSAVKGNAIVGVAEYLIDIQQRFVGVTEEDRLQAWAIWARPGDYITITVKGFGLAGFQYLRMLFGADTTKPDTHIIAYVSNALEREVTDVHALYVLERAAELSGQSLRRLDGLIWERAARSRSRPAT